MEVEQHDQYSYRCPNHTGNLNDARLQNKWCDVTIRVSEKEFRAHKVILGSNLKYFQTMFSNDSFQESKEGVVTMEYVDGADLEAFVTYAYTGEILLTKRNALRLLMTANYLAEDGIKEACIEFLKKSLREQDACRAYQFANSIDCVALNNAAKATTITNFRDCSVTSEYLDLDYESLMDILYDAKAQPVSSQKIFFEGIMRWIMYDVKGRKDYMNNLLISVDLAKISIDDFVGFLYGNVVNQNDEYNIIKDVKHCYHTSKLIEVERKKQEPVLMIVGYAVPVKATQLCFQIYSFVERKWFPPENISNADMTEFSRSTVLNDKFYYIKNSTVNDHYLEVFDPATKQSTLLNSSSVMNCFNYSAMCEDGKSLYFCGGSQLDVVLTDRVLRYDPQADLFVELRWMANCRSDATAIFYEGYLHVLGGFDGLNELNSVEKYDPDTKKWTTFPSMTIPRSDFQVAVLDGKLYACGGCMAEGDEARVEVYDPTTASWRGVASMSKRGIRFCVIAHEGKLLVFGGSSDENVEVYEPSKDQWHTDREMLSGLKINIISAILISPSCVANFS